MLTLSRRSGRVALARTGAVQQVANFSSGPDVTPADPKSLDFANMGFDYTPTKSMAKYNFTWTDGWDQGELSNTPYLQIHALSNVIHYGQSIFEGLKAFHLADGRVTAFNPKANAARMRAGAERLGMPEVPESVFLEAITRVVKDNVDYVPPYGTDGSFYLRPFLTGHGAKLGLGVAPQFLFVGSPAGNYYKAGIKPINALVIDYDRAAPRGVGAVKCAGNYAADVKPAKKANEQGYEIALYLDAKERKYVEEFSTSNLIAISADKKTLITPASDSILPSITNVMLQQLAKDRGMNVERRKVAIDELENFSEVGACGTAVIISPIGSVTYKGERKEFAKD
eukprot:CAMPEP_0171456618 /NCGR_PEP_ID=MMETSP0945-20130129/3031_1 /TAXON_ID=109269 /ORGANISM="Vaucheria litorea, Strain CCMP2940" /LENGTH=339 /DNA_ID=CAMNT_0011982075 /DNA_START=78 /DNA_END=1094 /DNA_ORIENTATION=+